MKKKTIALALGLTLGIGMCGGALVACGGGKTPANDDPYYLCGTSKSDMFAAGGEWYNGYKTPASIPDVIHFSKGEDNTHVITVNLYKNDEIAILKAGDGWTGQMGFNHIPEEVQEAEGAQIVEGGGYDIKNMKVAVTGEYTFTISFDEFNAPIVNYTYNKEIEELPTPATAVSFAKTKVSLGIGDEKTLNVKVTPADTTDKVVWTSSNEAVATVDENGKVKGIAKGTAMITATAGEKSANCAVTVLGEGETIAATAVTFADESKTLHAGEKFTLEATMAPEDTTDELEYTSSDEDVVTVDATTGEITAVKPGTATITATARDGVEGTIEITVEKDYYLIGTVNEWTLVDKLEVEDVIYLTETATKGVYKTESVELEKGAEFKINTVGNVWDDGTDIGAAALNTEDDTVKYSKNNGGNIKIRTHGKYTITLDTTGEEAVISVEQDEQLADPVVDWSEKDFYIRGAVNDWGQVTDKTSEYMFTNAGDGKYTLTVELAANSEFKLCVFGEEGNSGWDNAIGSGDLGNSSGLEEGGGGNIKATVSGTYTLTYDASAELLTCTVVPAA